MTFLYWSLFSVSVLGILGCIYAVLRARAYYGRDKTNIPLAAIPKKSSLHSIDGLSVIVPLKGVDIRTEIHLRLLLMSKLDVPFECIFAMETKADPAYRVCMRVVRDYPHKVARILLSGDPGERMGKQHNLSKAVKIARYQQIASMDADVSVATDTLAQGLAALELPDVGIAFSLPYYAGSGPLGGTLVAAYTNYYFSLQVGALALGRSPNFTIGSLWFARRDTLEKIGGLEQFTHTVTDDAALGKAVAAAGLRNFPLPNPVQIAFEQLDLNQGFRHLQKWIAMLRAESLVNYLIIFITWHFLLWACLTTLLGLILDLQTTWSFSAVLLVVAILVRAGSLIALNRWVYKELQPAQFLLVVFLYEILVVPVLFGIGLFRRRITWRGREYLIGKGGEIMKIMDK